MVCYYRTRKGLRFYAIEDDRKKKIRWALTNLNHSTIGRIVRLRITEQTIKEELMRVNPGDVPLDWRVRFSQFFWRSKL